MLFRSRLRRVGTVGAPEALDRRVRLPAGFEQVMDAQTAIPRTEIGMVAAARAAGVAEHEDALLVVHEGLRLGEIGRAGPALDAQTITPVIASDTHDAPRAAGDLGDHVGAEPLHALIERALHRRKGPELCD